MTEKDTPEIALRIRIKSLPIPGEFDEFDLRPYRIGGTYELPLRLASLLILGGTPSGPARQLWQKPPTSAGRRFLPGTAGADPAFVALYACLIQPLERCSASVHRSRSAAVALRGIAGSNRRSTFHCPLMASTDGQKPTARPAR